jgi:hypothetical protein
MRQNTILHISRSRHECSRRHTEPPLIHRTHRLWVHTAHTHIGAVCSHTVVIGHNTAITDIADTDDSRLTTLLTNCCR